MDLITTTFGQFLEQWAALTPDKDFIVYPDRGLRFSYRTFNDRVDNLAKSMLQLGLTSSFSHSLGKVSEDKRKP